MDDGSEVATTASRVSRWSNDDEGHRVRARGFVLAEIVATAAGSPAFRAAVESRIRHARHAFERAPDSGLDTDEKPLDRRRGDL
jgi:hypothetical protein